MILHYCQILIDKSVPRVSLWHHEAYALESPSVQTIFSFLRYFFDLSCRSMFEIALSRLCAGLQLQLPFCPAPTDDLLTLRHMTFVCV